MHLNGRTLRVVLSIALAASLTLARATCADAQSTPLRALVSVTVNGVDGGIRQVSIGEGDVRMARSDLEALRLTKVLDAMQPEPGASVSLNALKPALTYTFDESRLILAIAADPQYLPLSSIDLRSTPTYSISRTRSEFLNYGEVVTTGSRGDFSSQLGATLGTGVASATFNVVDDGYRPTNVNWTVDDLANLSRFVAGDAYVDLGDLSGSGVFRGLTFERDFGLSPYAGRLVTRSLGGYVATPATADVYVNGHLVTRLDLPPGAFNLSNLPLLDGLNDAQVIVRDAFGNVQTLNQNYYEGLQTLPRGLDDFSWTLGELEDGQGHSRSGTSAVGRYSRGLSDAVTLGGRVEGSPQMLDGGPTLALTTRFGELDVIGLASSAAGSSGAAGEALYDFASNGLSASLGVQLQSKHYATIALSPFADRTLSNVVAGLTFPIRRQSLSLTLTNSQDRDQGHIATLGALTTFRLTRELSLLVQAERRRTPSGTRSGVYTILELPLGRQSETFATLTKDFSTSNGSTTYAIERAARPDVPLGFNLSSTATTGQNQDLVAATYESTFGTYSVERAELQGESTTQFDAAGSLVYVGGHVIPSRPVTQAFVVVDTNGLANVPVAANGIRIGTTDKAGFLAIPDVTPYGLNSIAIDTANLPLDLDFNSSEQKVTPGYLSAAVVRFNATRTQSFVGNVTMTVGTKTIVPKYDTLTIFLAGGKTVSSEIAEDGQFYFSNLPPGAHVAKIDGAETCDLTVVIPDTKTEYVRLGTLQCTANAPSI